MLEVTALEKHTGLSKTVTMQTGEQGDRFDIAHAREQLSAMMGAKAPDTGSGEAQNPSGRPALIAAAKALRKRAVALIDVIDATDAEELQNLLTDSQEAIGGGDMDRLARINDSLGDMLFYLED